jgi:predicted  nucleic acid-binding Zn-ribbon protein
LAHRQQTLPDTARLAELGETRSALASRLAVQRTEVDDLTAEIDKAENDVALVRTRRVRDQQRLDTGAVTSAKDLEGLQREVVSLDRRIATLEDAELEVMERLEQAQAEQQRLDKELAGIDAEMATVAARRDAELRSIATEVAELTDERHRAAQLLPPDLLALYERVRAQHGGVGVGALRQHRCEACRLELNAADLRELAATAEDEVPRCPECDRLLVRTAESGL